jgi:nucleotide-binding universal stress UspA family protein
MSTAAWHTILIGVDPSPASVPAARLGSALAHATGATVRLVHATPEAWTVPSAPHTFAINPDGLNEAARDAARGTVEQLLHDTVPADALARLEVRSGRPARVLRDAAHELDVGLVVLGGKHHSAIGRWVVGSTAHALARSLDVPLLVAIAGGPIRKVLAAVDLSEAAGPTVHAAERFAGMLGASLRVLHVVEPLPVIPDTPLHFNDDEVLERSREHLERYVWPLINLPDAETVIRRGLAVDVIAADAATEGADLVVVGSHGKGWVDRILIGSVTERVLSALPVSVLVVPVTGAEDRWRSDAKAGRGQLHAG